MSITHVFHSESQDMVAIPVTMCNPCYQFSFSVSLPNTAKSAAIPAENASWSLFENNYNINYVKTQFSRTLGGLQSQIDSIICRAVNDRVNPKMSKRLTELHTLLDLE
jgi:hypothetical protein